MCGKTTHGVIHGSLEGPVKTIKIVGKEMPTRAEDEQCSVVLNVLLGKCVLQKSYYTRLIWRLSKTEKKLCRTPATSGPTSPLINYLNDSQKMAVASILGGDKIVLVHGM